MHFKQLAACLAGTTLVALSCAAIAAPHKVLSNYAELLQALQAGDKVRAVINFDNCELTSGKHMSISGGFSFNVFNHYFMPVDATHTKEVIATSKTIFAITDIDNLGPVNNYIRLHVYKDNTATLFGAMVDPKTYEQKMTVKYACPLNRDVNRSGVVLYDLDA